MSGDYQRSSSCVEVGHWDIVVEGDGRRGM